MAKKLKVCPWCGHDLDGYNCPALGMACNRAATKNGKTVCLMNVEAEAKATGRCGYFDSAP